MILKILKVIFITLGVIFSLLIVAVIVFIIVDPFNLRPLLSDLRATDFSFENISTELTPDKANCLVEALGEKRAQEIVNGASPSVTDVMTAKDCFIK